MGASNAKEQIGAPNQGSKVLVIDDDPDVARLLNAILQPQGFDVYRACDGSEGLKNAYEIHPALVVLDVIMPGMNGWDVCVRLREMSDVPILILTARSAEADLLRGFVLGADDYMKKPFSSAELEARVLALLRRQINRLRSPSISHYTDRVLKIDLETRRVEFEGKTLHLSMTEYSLLACLARNMGITVSHEQLLREVWGCKYGDMYATLALHIHNLRKKLKSSQYDHDYVQTQWGRGYCFVPLNEI